MKPAFVAGFAPIVKDVEASRAFWADGLGITFNEIAPGYWATDDLRGVKHFGLWPLSEAAEACFGTNTWPADIPEPNSALELDVESADAVAPAAAEMTARGYRLLVGPKEEPWGQTVARLLSPEGILVGIVYTPWMHEARPETEP
jgi:catechol 2,3-dioxygenase-like lactoylglutathione lyase family enzyme